jgi:thiol-disulfide isomerase/thioredoxin
MRLNVFAAAVLAAAASTLVACAEQGSTTPSGAPGTSSAAAPPSPSSASSAAAPDASSTATVPAALQFTGTTLEGQPFDGATLAGKPTVLWFWAPWCPKCKAQGPETAKVAAQFQGKANVVGVAGLDKLEAMKRFVGDAKVATFPHLSDEAGAIWKKFEITQQSFYVVLDKNGKTVFTGNLPGGKGLADKVGPLAG